MAAPTFLGGLGPFRGPGCVLNARLVKHHSWFASTGSSEFGRLDPGGKNGFPLRRRRLMSLPKNTLDELRIDRPAVTDPGAKGRLVMGPLIGLAVLAAGFWWFSRSKALEVRTVMVRE